MEQNANDYTDDEFDAELKKDMDAGEKSNDKKQWHQEILKTDSTDEKRSEIFNIS